MALRWFLPPMMLLAAACSNQSPQPKPSASPPTQATLPTQANLGERTVETQPMPTPPPATTFAAAKPDLPKVKTPSDDRLPSWVPKSGRLSVISSVDHAKNLGMDDESAQPVSTTNISSATWLPKNGRITTGRSARATRR